MSSMNLSDLSILLIEPSAMQRKVILTHLLEEGVSKVDGVETGEAALDLIQNYTHHLLPQNRVCIELSIRTLEQ